MATFPCRFGRRCGSLSLFFMMCVKEILRLGRNYEFPRPKRCLREGCGSSRIWGHGFVERNFDECDESIPLRKWRCDDCGCVYTIRPLGYWPRHHTPIHIILACLCHWLTQGSWDRTPGPSRECQYHWRRALARNIKAHLGMNFPGTLVEGFFELIHDFRVPVFRSD